MPNLTREIWTSTTLLLYNKCSWILVSKRSLLYMPGFGRLIYFVSIIQGYWLFTAHIFHWNKIESIHCNISCLYSRRGSNNVYVLYSRVHFYYLQIKDCVEEIVHWFYNFFFKYIVLAFLLFYFCNLWSFKKWKKMCAFEKCFAFQICDTSFFHFIYTIYIFRNIKH